MSNILVQFPEIQQAINQAGTGSVTIGPPTFKKSTVELTELVSDSTGIHLNHWGWGSNDTQKKDFASAFRLDTSYFSNVNIWWPNKASYVTMDKGSTFYYDTSQMIKSLGIISFYSPEQTKDRYLISFNMNRFFLFRPYYMYETTEYQKQVPILQKRG